MNESLNFIVCKKNDGLDTTIGFLWDSLVKIKTFEHKNIL